MVTIKKDKNAKWGQKKVENINTLVTSGVSSSIWDDPERTDFQPSEEEEEEEEWTGGYVEQEKVK